MLYELILINEIEQRAKIIFLSASTKAVTVETHELCKNGAGRHWKNQISYDKDYTTFIKTVTEHKTNDKKEKQIEKNVKEKNDSFVLDNAIIINNNGKQNLWPNE